MTRYSQVVYTPVLSKSSGVASGEVLSITAAIGSTEAGYLNTIMCNDLADIKRGFVMYLWDANVAVGNISAAFSPSDTAADNLISMVTFSSGGQIDLVNSVFYQKFAAKGDAGMGVYCKNAASSVDASIYCTLTCVSTGTFTSTVGLRFTFGFRHD